MRLCKIGLHKYNKTESTNWEYIQGVPMRTHSYQCLYCNKIKEDLEIDRT